jgi:alkylation response protein AidB-like acyl-CoA dehydrogenase
MDLELTAEQQSLTSEVKAFSEEVLRHNWTRFETDDRLMTEAWAEAGKRGLTRFWLPDHKSRDGVDFTTMVLAVSELARGDGGLALIMAHQYLCYRLAALTPSRELQRKVIEQLSVSEWGFGPVPLWPDPNDSRWLPEQFASNGPTEGNLVETQNRLYGACALCPCKADASDFLVCGRVSGDRPRGVVMLLSSATNHNISLHPTNSLGLQSLKYHRVSFQVDLSECSLAVFFSNLKEYFRLQNQILAERALLSAAIILGIAQASFDYALDYSRKRVTFGKTINQHQAVALKLADIGIGIEASKLALWESVNGAVDDMDQSVVWSVWNLVRKTGIEVATNSVKILGGHGYLKLHPVEKWLRDIQFLSLLVSDTRYLSSPIRVEPEPRSTEIKRLKAIA